MTVIEAKFRKGNDAKIILRYGRTWIWNCFTISNISSIQCHTNSRGKLSGAVFAMRRVCSDGKQNYGFIRESKYLSVSAALFLPYISLLRQFALSGLIKISNNEPYTRNKTFLGMVFYRIQTEEKIKRDSPTSNFLNQTRRKKMIIAPQHERRLTTLW